MRTLGGVEDEANFIFLNGRFNKSAKDFLSFQNKCVLGVLARLILNINVVGRLPSHLKMYQRKLQYSPHDLVRKNIVYIFQYPNLPSFGNEAWSSNYLTLDLSSVAGSLVD